MDRDINRKKSREFKIKELNWDPTTIIVVIKKKKILFSKNELTKWIPIHPIFKFNRRILSFFLVIFLFKVFIFLCVIGSDFRMILDFPSNWQIWSSSYYMGVKLSPRSKRQGTMTMFCTCNITESDTLLEKDLSRHW